jgi:hypothetical protein
MLKSKIHRATVAAYDGWEMAAHSPPDVQVDARNRIAPVDCGPAVLLGSRLASGADFSVPGELSPGEVLR